MKKVIFMAVATAIMAIGGAQEDIRVQLDSINSICKKLDDYIIEAGKVKLKNDAERLQVVNIIERKAEEMRQHNCVASKKAETIIFGAIFTKSMLGG